MVLATTDVSRWALESTRPQASRQEIRSPIQARALPRGTLLIQTIAKLEEGFERHAAVGKKLTDVYAETMRKTFRFKVMRIDGKAMFTDPKGGSVPSFWQFRYYCQKKFTSAEMRRALMGDQKYRNEVAPTMGSYASELTNLAEQARGDACYSKDYLKSYLGAESPGKLCIATFYCSVSGMAMGIGFSLTETARAYNAALFCMAIPKSKFGEIMGYPISDDDWPGHGIAAEVVTDRGPGSSSRVALPHDVSRSVPPSFTPQSNGTAESRHQREKKARRVHPHTK